jgi:RNA polymerase sigma-70 factor (ECF subfamily)
VARRVLANQRRGERRRSALNVRLRADLSLAIRDRGLRSEPAPVSAAFDSLPERDRELLSLAAWEGLDAGEIAEVLGCSRNTARVRMHRARQRFARELHRHGEAAHAQMVTA